MAIRSQTQRTLLLTFISSVVLTALLGMYALLAGRQSAFEEEILVSTTIIGGASILAMASAVPMERRIWHPIGYLGIIAAAIATLLSLGGIWLDLFSIFHGNEYYVRVTGISWVFAVAFPHLGLVSLARLRKQLEWARVATVVFITMLAVQIILTVIIEPNDDIWYRLMGIFGIAVACGTISLPVLHKYSAIHKREQVRTVELALSLVCPRCNSSQTLSVGHSACGQCGLKFHIEIEEEQCRKCGYPLYQIQSAVCPECGTPIARTPPPVATVNATTSI